MVLSLGSTLESPREIKKLVLEPPTKGADVIGLGAAQEQGNLKVPRWF